MSDAWYRPLPQGGTPRPADALPLAGGALWFDTVMVHQRGTAPAFMPAAALPSDVRGRLTASRAAVCGLDLAVPRIMGILNITPDSFSDGGRHAGLDAAVARAWAMVEEGADILDVGGESTRPGAHPVSEAEEIERVVPVIARLRADGFVRPISIDTRSAAVAAAAFDAGADLFNDVSALTHDAASLPLAAARQVPICLMHAKGTPQTMQEAPAYEDVLLDVADWLEARVSATEAAGIPRARLLVDPGIGFGKTTEHNLALVRGLGLLHGLGCGILFGASRKRFIGALTGAPDPGGRLPGSLTVALEALRQGAQVIQSP